MGCGVGGWLAEASSLGVENIQGFDGDYVARSMLKIPEEYFQPKDLSKPIKCERRFDLALSLEVAEHIDEGDADIFIQNLVDLSDVILFSAAIPGQGGVEHINEQWPEYWINIFSNKGYHFVDCLREKFWDDITITPCYRQNAFLFIKNGSSSF